ncbi:hypothetical protein EI555_000339, partial [Monodon monoceros]
FWNPDLCTPRLPTLGTGSPAQCGFCPDLALRAFSVWSPASHLCFQPRVSGVIGLSPFLIETPNASYQASPAWSQRLFHCLGRTIVGTPDEETMDIVLAKNYSEMVGIVFNDTHSYWLKFSWGHRIPVMREHFEYSEHCRAMRDEIFCSLTTYWQRGFVAFQTTINAAIIEVTTNRSVMEELTSVIGINMRTPPFISKEETTNEWFIFICVVYFSLFVYIIKHYKGMKKI